MKIPESITQKQLTEALELLGLDPGTVLSLSCNALSRTVHVELSPIPDHPLVVRSIAEIPIIRPES